MGGIVYNVAEEIEKKQQLIKRIAITNIAKEIEAELTYCQYVLNTMKLAKVNDQDTFDKLYKWGMKWNIMMN